MRGVQGRTATLHLDTVHRVMSSLAPGGGRGGGGKGYGVGVFKIHFSLGSCGIYLDYAFHLFFYK